MSKHFFAVAFGIGLACIAWVGLGFVGTSWLALAITAVIGGVYLLGAVELHQFRAANSGLARALADGPQPVSSLGEWLEGVPPALRNAVRLRVEGERAGLPGPALTPYLVGLLVMLGMLGTFLGMVVTFQGAVFALEGSGDLQAMRSALAEPIKGLGLSFGTSVAGVAASAMLGLMSAICRRERLDLAREVDGRIATVLRPFSLAQQRHDAFRALQVQATALPEVFRKIELLMERIDRRGEQLDAQLLQRQADFHRDVSVAYTGLAQAVGSSLQDSLAAGARAAGESIQPVVASAMAQIVDQAHAHGEMLSRQFDQRSTAVLGAVQDGFARAQSDQVAAEQVRIENWTGSLRMLADGLQKQWQRVGDQAIAHEAAVTQHLATLGASLEAPIKRLLHTAAEVPQAAASVLAQLRKETTRVAEQDNAALQERGVLLEQVARILNDVNQASGEQRAAIESLVTSASGVLEQAGGRFAEVLDAHGSKAADMAVHVNASAVELASLGEAFGHSVQLFQATNEKLLESLQRIEQSINRSTARSDEQLAYYVAQAREVIDLSIASQHGLVDNLRQLQVKPAVQPAGALG